MLSFSTSSSGESIDDFLKRAASDSIQSALDKYGRDGVAALAASTPVDEGLTARSWTYEIIKDTTGWSIIWGNTNVVNGTPVAVLIQVGHATGTGGYVQGRDFINPAMRPIFDQIANAAWKEVNR